MIREKGSRIIGSGIAWIQDLRSGISEESFQGYAIGERGSRGSGDTKRGDKRSSGRHVGGLWEVAGGYLETSGRHLGGIWRHLGGIWRHLEASGGPGSSGKACLLKNLGKITEVAFL